MGRRLRKRWGKFFLRHPAYPHPPKKEKNSQKEERKRVVQKDFEDLGEKTQGTCCRQMT